MNLSEQIYRRAKAHNKGTALHIEMMKWAKEAQRLEQLQDCIKPLERPFTTDASEHSSQEERQGSLHK